MRNITLTISKFNIFQIVWGVILVITSLLAWYNRPDFGDNLGFWMSTSANLCLINCLILLWLTLHSVYLLAKKKPVERSPFICVFFIIVNFVYIGFMGGLLLPTLTTTPLANA